MKLGKSMERYVAFLRGINISGKNKISMTELKSEFEKAGFSEVSTYLNSGNVGFSSKIDDIEAVITKMLIDKFGLSISAYVIKVEELKDILSNSPIWWDSGKKEWYDNLIFILSTDTPQEIYDLIGRPSSELEMVKVYKNVIFWTFDRKLYQKCNWWKRTATVGIAEKLTIRTANTLKKVVK